MQFQHGVKLGPPRLGHFAMNGRYTSEQRCGRDLALVALSSISKPPIFNETGDEGFDGFEHRLSYLRKIWPVRTSDGNCLGPSRCITDLFRRTQMAFTSLQNNWLTKL